jgi:hypothetical protein
MWRVIDCKVPHNKVFGGVGGVYAPPTPPISFLGGKIYTFDYPIRKNLK